jgi:hypothetical protein
MKKIILLAGSKMAHSWDAAQGSFRASGSEKMPLWEPGLLLSAMSRRALLSWAFRRDKNGQ